MIVRLTRKLAKKIKVEPADALPFHPNPFADWAANLFTVRRDQYVLLTNSASLYSVIFRGRGIVSADSFLEHAISALAAQLRSGGFGAIFDQCITPLMREFTFSKTGDRSLLGSMNDHVRCAGYDLEDPDESPLTASCRLNETPMGALDYCVPLEVLAMQAGIPARVKRTGAKVIPFPRKA